MHIYYNIELKYVVLIAKYTTLYITATKNNKLIVISVTPSNIRIEQVEYLDELFRHSDYENYEHKYSEITEILGITCFDTYYNLFKMSKLNNIKQNYVSVSYLKPFVPANVYRYLYNTSLEYGNFLVGPMLRKVTKFSYITYMKIFTEPTALINIVVNKPKSNSQIILSSHEAETRRLARSFITATAPKPTGLPDFFLKF
jgi:hypothetical protein